MEDAIPELAENPDLVFAEGLLVLPLVPCCASVNEVPDRIVPEPAELIPVLAEEEPRKTLPLEMLKAEEYSDDPPSEALEMPLNVLGDISLAVPLLGFPLFDPTGTEKRDFAVEES